MAHANGAVLVISSHVVRGCVGNRAIVFILERLGFPVWAMPTIVLPHHPGQGRAKRLVADDGDFAETLRALVMKAGPQNVAAIVSGYFATPAQARATAEIVRLVKAARPGAFFLCDPVIGDDGALYVDPVLAETIRDDLLPLGDLATPNAFECAWLGGVDPATAGSDAAALAALARRLPPPAMLVTSAPGMLRGAVANVLVAEGRTALFEHRRAETLAKGTGDLVAGLITAHRLSGLGWDEAVTRTLASVADIVAGTARAGAPDLLLPQFQEALIHPRTAVTMRAVMG